MSESTNCLHTNNKQNGRNSTSNDEENEVDYWYFDNTSNGYYYQHSGTQGWKRTSNQTNMPASAAQYRQQSANRGPLPAKTNNERGNGGGDRESSTSTNNANHQNGAAQWHGRQNGQFKRSYKNNSDYWNKNLHHNEQNRENSAVKRNDENVGPINDNKPKPFYHRNDRWQGRNTAAPVGVQRGPLPDWDEVAEAAGNEGTFDYMDLMESQYNQIYAMMQMPPFDPMKGAAAIPGYMVPIMSNTQWAFRAPVMGGVPMAMQQAGMMPTSSVDKRFKGPIHAPQQSPPSSQSLASPSASQNESPQPATSVQSPQPLTQQPQASSNQQPSSSDSRPDSVASSLTSTIPPTPTNLMSPNAVQMPVASVRPAQVIPNTPTMYPFIAPFTGVFAPIPPPLPEIRGEDMKEILCKQIEYYFSVDNLQKDFFLRRRMDKQGFLPLSLISSFPRVSQVTRDLNMIATALSDSERVELDSTKQRVRTRFNPEIWPMELQSQFSGGEISPRVNGTASREDFDDQQHQPLHITPPASAYPESQMVAESSNKPNSVDVDESVVGKSPPIQERKPKKSPQKAKPVTQISIKGAKTIEPAKLILSEIHTKSSNQEPPGTTIVEESKVVAKIVKLTKEIANFDVEPVEVLQQPDSTAGSDELNSPPGAEPEAGSANEDDEWQEVKTKRNKKPPRQKRVGPRNFNRGHVGGPRSDAPTRRANRNRLDEETENGFRRSDEERWQKEGQRDEGETSPLTTMSPQVNEATSESSSQSGDGRSPTLVSVWTKKAMERAAASASTPQSPGAKSEKASRCPPEESRRPAKTSPAVAEPIV